tara:strand:+ start:183 stop:383 length:201 start_codon:yes stop_codon:yes gene_type:complete
MTTPTPIFTELESALQGLRAFLDSTNADWESATDYIESQIEGEISAGQWCEVEKVFDEHQNQYQGA